MDDIISKFDCKYEILLHGPCWRLKEQSKSELTRGQQIFKKYMNQFAAPKV